MTKAPDHICLLPFAHQVVFPDGRSRVCCASEPEQNTDQPHGTRVGWAADSWNSPYMREVRRDFLAGKTPDACARCIAAENSGYSRRVRESRNISNIVDAGELLSKTQDDGWSPYNLTSIEIRYDRTCKGQCVMCGPEHSSAWSNLARRLSSEYGADFPTDLAGKYPPFDYAELGRQSRHLSHVTFAGGEPFLSRDHEAILERLLEEFGEGALTIQYLTSGEGFKNHWLGLWRRFKKVQVFLSVDGPPHINDYIRFPLTWERAMSFARYALDSEVPDLELTLQLTVQALNLPFIRDFVMHPDTAALMAVPSRSVFFGFHMLRDPTMLSVSSVDNSLKAKVIRELETVAEYVNAHQRKGARTVDDIVNAVRSSEYNVALKQEAIKFFSQIDTIRGCKNPAGHLSASYFSSN